MTVGVGRAAPGPAGSTAPATDDSEQRSHAAAALPEQEQGDQGQGSDQNQEQQPARGARRGRKGKAVPRLKATAEISRLQRAIARHKEQLAALECRHGALASEARAAQIAVAQCLALLRLGALLQERGGGGGGGGSGGRCEAAPPLEAGSATSGCPAPVFAREAWALHLEQMCQELERVGVPLLPPLGSRAAAGDAAAADSRASRAEGSALQPASGIPDAISDTGAEADAAIEAERKALGWSPLAAVRAAPRADLSASGLRRVIKQFTQRTCHLCM
jgi:hypothetical protein